MATILSASIFQEVILPFLLIFTVVFAILQRTKILGDGKKQIDAIVGAVVGLLAVSYLNYMKLISNLVGVMVVLMIVILVFLILYGMAFVNEEFKLPKWVASTIGVVSVIVIVLALMFFTNGWAYLQGLLSTGSGDWSGSTIFVNVVVIVVIVAAVFFMWKSDSGSDKK